MIALIQRASQARVVIDGQTVGQIGAGLLVLVCAERGDFEAQADKLLAKILKLRIFSDDAGKMNRSVQDLDGRGSAGGLLLVSQFTLAADTSSGNRPGFSNAAPPDEGRRLYDYLVARARYAPRGADRAVRRRHAGAPGQRRACDDSAAHRSAIKPIAACVCPIWATG